MSGVIFRTAQLPELAQVLDWAAQEGWNPGLEDAAAFHAADPDGFFVATIGGQTVAAISVVNHCDSFAFLGLYLCHPEFRGQGIGFALWRHALNHAGQRNIGLDGVPAQEANYARSGFVFSGRTLRLSGQVAPEPLDYPIASSSDYPELEKLDIAANGMSRPRFLRAWLENQPTRKTVLLRKGGAVCGFATARICRQGCKIGPVVATNAEDAYRLACAAAGGLQQDRVVIDIPDAAASFAALLRQNGFTNDFSTARMFRGSALQSGATLQAVASLELG
ncbi:MAG: GNAT family N-acetyltransferase [Rhodobacteraceae bacterium]|nr:GNAT family N-acetyltransferase [Paracoccaceae bacterium]